MRLRWQKLEIPHIAVNARVFCATACGGEVNQYSRAVSVPRSREGVRARKAGERSSRETVREVSFAHARHTTDREEARWRANRAGRVARAARCVHDGARTRLSDGGVSDGRISARTRS